MHLRMTVPADLSDAAVEVLAEDPAVTGLSVIKGVALKPPGDVIHADLAREAANDVIDRLRALGVQHDGTLQLDQVGTWLSRSGLDAEERAPGSSADSVVWAEVTRRGYDDSELNWTFMSFMVMATLLAAIAIVLDSQVLTIGAMVLGPEFGAVAALGVALVRRRWTLLGFAARALLAGFPVAIAVTALAGVLGREIGWITAADISVDRSATAFIYHPDKWSFIVALLAGAAGVLSLTSAKVGGLSGVFISVTTIPAAGNVGLALAFADWSEARGSAIQLVVNLAGMALAGWATLLVQNVVWSRVSAYRARLMAKGLRRNR